MSLQQKPQIEGVKMNLESIGQNIRHFRLEQHLRQGDVARRTGLTANYIGMIERGEKLPSLETFVIILNALDLSADLVLSDVLLRGHIVKASALHERLSGLTDHDKALVHAIIDALMRHF